MIVKFFQCQWWMFANINKSLNIIVNNHEKIRLKNQINQSALIFKRNFIKLSKMDVFLMIRRKKLTIFTDAKDTTTVLELKKIIEGILKVPTRNQKLFNRENNVMEDEKQLQDYGLTSNTAKAQNPATIGLAVRDDNGPFEPLELTPYSAPPDLPDVMKTPETNGQEQSA